MKTLRHFAAIALLVAAGPAAARAQVAVVAVKSADGLIAGARSLLGAMGGGPAFDPAVAFLDKLKAPGTLKGVDLGRPAGAYVEIPAQGGEVPYVVVLVPVADPADFFATLTAAGVTVVPVEKTPAVTHTLTIQGAGPIVLHGKVEGGYATFATRPAGPPADAALRPAAVLAGAPGLLSARLRIDRIPAPSKQLMLDQTKAGAVADRDRKPGEDDPSYLGRMAGMDVVLDAFTALLRDGGDMILSLDVAEGRGDLAVDLVFKPLPGTAMAGSFRDFGAAPSLFRGIAGGSIANGWARVPLSDGVRKLFATISAKGRDDATKGEASPEAKAAMTEMVAVFEPILTGPDADLGLALHGPLEGGDKVASFAAVVAARVADGGRADRLCRTLAAALAKSPTAGIEKMTLDADKAGEVPIHEIRLASNAFLARFGEPVVWIAARPNALAVALGRQGLPALKQALDSIASPPPRGPDAPGPIQVSAAVGKVARFAAGGPDGQARLNDQFQAAGVLQGADAARDRVGMTLVGGDSLALRLRVDGPLLKLLATLGVANRAGQPAPR